MLRSTLSIGLAWAAATPWGACAATAERTTFDCSQAQGEVEQLVCSDARLSALDQQLAAAYQSALKNASGSMAGQLRTEQRGWVKGRNDCWKARAGTTWITATWTVDSVRGCVEAQYRLRTAELQAVWRLRPPKTVAYTCELQPANEVVLSFFDTDPATLRLERGDRSATLWRVGEPEPARAAGTSLYEGRNVSAELAPPALRLTTLNTTTGQTEALQCLAR
ncbi:MAG: lysozyme inhibitor LprI family protein [Rubrivivax sp.]|jgi:uncharacterized protein YecT (DUF1311 family)